MDRVLSIIAGCLIVSSEAAAQAPPLWMDLEPGSFTVGFRVVWTADPTRSMPPLDARPLRLMTWYPAERADSARLRFDAYLRPTAPAAFTAYNDSLMARERSTASRQTPGSPDSVLQWIRQVETPSIRDADPAPGRFPLVVHSLGRNDYQAESTVLWEYLASHGFVVVVVPQYGATLASPRGPFDLAAVDLQATDMLVALREARALPFVDAGWTAFIGHSMGGVAMLLAAAVDTTVDALVALDGSAGTTDGTALLAPVRDRLGGLDGRMLNVYAAGKRDLDLTLLEHLPRLRRMDVALGAGRPPELATHFDFQNWPLFLVHRGIEDPRGAAARPAALGRDFFVAAVRLTRYFLDATLRADPAAFDYVSGARPLPGIRADLVSRPPS